MTFAMNVLTLFNQASSISETLASVRKVYEVIDIPNRIVDGNVPFPENQQSLHAGISVEFRQWSLRALDGSIAHFHCQECILQIRRK
jgi:hypothetical protein